MKIDVITIFPKQVENFTKEGLFRIAREEGHEINVHDLRNWTDDKHKTVDDRPFGGGAGMVMKVEPIHKAVEDLKSNDTLVVLTGPSGKKLDTKMSKNFSTQSHLIIICGHYEGVDERVRENVANVEVSIGDYVLSGGELPALVIIDALLRHVEGVLGNPESLSEESFEGDLVSEYPQYTRPSEYNGWKVPKILLSGDHKDIAKWRKKMSCK